MRNRHGCVELGLLLVLLLVFVHVVSIAGSAWLLLDAYASWRLGAELRLAQQQGMLVEMEEVLAARPDADRRDVTAALLGATEALDPDAPAFGQITFPASAVTFAGLPTPDEAGLLRETMAEQSQALGLLDEAPLEPGAVRADWPIEWQRPPVATVLPHLQPQRQLMRLQQAAIYDAAACGRWDEWARRILTLEAHSETLTEPPLIVQVYVSFGGHTQLTESILTLAPHMRIGDDEGQISPQQVRRLIEQMREEQAIHQSVLRGMEGELAILYRGTLHPMVPDAVEKVAAPQASLAVMVRPWAEASFIRLADPIVKLEDARGIRLTRRVRAIYPEAETLPDFLQPAREELREAAEMGLTRPFSPLLIPSYDHLGHAGFNLIRDRRLAATQLAALLYEHDHGQLPPDLDALVPAYLDAVPLDPHDPGAGRLRYDPQRALIWSVGGNGIDNGGTWRIGPGWTNRQVRERTDRVASLKPMTPEEARLMQIAGR